MTHCAIDPFLVWVFDNGRLSGESMGEYPEPEGFGILRHSPMESRTPNPEPGRRGLGGVAPKTRPRGGFGKEV